MFKLIKSKFENLTDRLRKRRIRRMKELRDLCQEVVELMDKELK
jgi:hypothetical protein